MEALTVYTTGPQCGKCRMTKMMLDSKGVPYVEVNITENPDARVRHRGAGLHRGPRCRRRR
jgi:glutaredoxin-like protein NrdH